MHLFSQSFSIFNKIAVKILDMIYIIKYTLKNDNKKTPSKSISSHYDLVHGRLFDYSFIYVLLILHFSRTIEY